MTASYAGSAAGGSTSSSTPTVAITPAVGDLIVVFGYLATPNGTPTVTDDQSGTYTEVVPSGGPAFHVSTETRTLRFFVRDALAANTNSHTITYSDSNDAAVLVAVRYAGMTRTGADAVLQTDWGSTAAGVQQFPDFNGVAPGFGVAGLLCATGSADTDATGFSGDWTERQDANQSTPTAALQVCTNDVGQTIVPFGHNTMSTTSVWLTVQLDTSTTDLKVIATDTGGGTTGTTDRTVTVDPVAAGELWAIGCYAETNTNLTPTCSDDAGGTYSLVAAVTNATDGATLSVFLRNEPISAAEVTDGSLVVTVATGSNEAATIAVLKIDSDALGPLRFGSFAVKQVKTATGAASSAPAATFDAATLTSNLILGFVGSGDSSSTPPTGFTEHTEAGQATPTTRLETCSYRDNGDQRTTVTWGATQSTAWAAIILEIDASELVRPIPEVVTSWTVLDEANIDITGFHDLSDFVEGDLLTLHVFVDSFSADPTWTSNGMSWSLVESDSDAGLLHLLYEARVPGGLVLADSVLDFGASNGSAIATMIGWKNTEECEIKGAASGATPSGGTTGTILGGGDPGDPLAFICYSAAIYYPESTTEVFAFDSADRIDELSFGDLDYGSYNVFMPIGGIRCDFATPATIEDTDVEYGDDLSDGGVETILGISFAVGLIPAEPSRDHYDGRGFPVLRRHEPGWGRI